MFLNRLNLLFLHSDFPKIILIMSDDYTQILHLQKLEIFDLQNPIERLIHGSCC